MDILRSIRIIGLCAFVTGCSDDPEAPAETAGAATTSPPASHLTTPSASPVAAVEPAAPAIATAPPTATPRPVVEPPTPPPVAAGATGAAPAYAVECQPAARAAEQCQVDKETYVGWRTFAGQCQVCHGGSALGSTFAPNLLDRFHQRVDYARFVDVVRNGYHGQVGVMPAWKGNPNVEPHIDALYRYLSARADGTLPPGRPARKP